MTAKNNVAEFMIVFCMRVTAEMHLGWALDRCIYTKLRYLQMWMIWRSVLYLLMGQITMMSVTQQLSTQSCTYSRILLFGKNYAIHYTYVFCCVWYKCLQLTTRWANKRRSRSKFSDYACMTIFIDVNNESVKALFKCNDSKNHDGVFGSYGTCEPI